MVLAKYSLFDCLNALGQSSHNTGPHRCESSHQARVEEAWMKKPTAGASVTTNILAPC